MELYYGFKAEIENYNPAEKTTNNELLTIMLNVVKNNPSSIMSQYENDGKPHSLWSALLLRISGRKITADKQDEAS